MKPNIYIIILNWNGLKDTIECLNSLRKITYLNYKIILVDNGSNKNEGAILKKRFGNYIELIQNKNNLGFAGGNNVGTKYALDHETEYVLLLNNDTIVEPNFLDKIVEATNKENKIGIVGCKINYFNPKNELWFGGGRINWWRGFADHINFLNKNEIINKPCEVNFLTGCCMLINCKLLGKDIYFDERFFCLYEDADLCARTRNKRLKIYYNPKSLIYHKVSASSGGKLSNFALYYGMRNRLLFMKKNARFYHKLFFYPYIICIMAYYSYLSIKKGKFDIIKFTYRGFKDFLMNNFGLGFKKEWWK